MVPDYANLLGLNQIGQESRNLREYTKRVETKRDKALNHFRIMEHVFEILRNDVWMLTRDISREIRITPKEQADMVVGLDKLQNKFLGRLRNNARLCNQGLSWPLLIKPSESYFDSCRRLMIVGQQTCGWGNSTVDEKFPSYDNCLEKYAEWNLSLDRKLSPFWEAAHRLADSILENDRIAWDCFLWGNLFPCDQNKIQPVEALHSDLRAFRLLPAQIEMMKPDIVIFFTGPEYDYTIQTYFGNDCLKQTDHQGIARVTLPQSNIAAFRTYHPAYLKRKKTLYKTLDEIVLSIKESI